MTTPLAYQAAAIYPSFERTAKRAVRAEAEPAAGMAVQYMRGQPELAHGRVADAVAAFQAAERPAGQLATADLLARSVPEFLVLSLVRLGATEPAEQVIAGLGAVPAATRPRGLFVAGRLLAVEDELLVEQVDVIDVRSYRQLIEGAQPVLIERR